MKNIHSLRRNRAAMILIASYLLLLTTVYPAPAPGQGRARRRAPASTTTAPKKASAPAPQSTAPPQTTVPDTVKPGTVMANQLGMEFVYIPTGSFMMGSDRGAVDERPARRVTIRKGFYLGRYEITQAQW